MGENREKKVVVGLSGGVDSSVAAYLLKQQGYEVIGATLQTLPCETGSSLPLLEDVGKIAATLGIPYEVLDVCDCFKRNVIDYFTEEYLRGRTPNPCVVCNRKMKWATLLQYCDRIGAGYLATGHYARVEQLPNGRFTIRNSVTAKKDQTYALYQLTQEQLARTLMPIGDYTKEQIRQIAAEAELSVAGKPDSQEICFVPDNDYAGYLEQIAGERMPCPGNFVTAEGKVLGKHKGITHYTIGQRRGLEIALGERAFVTEIRPQTDEVVIGRNEELFVTHVRCEQFHFMAASNLEEPRRFLGKIRYNHSGEYCVAEAQEDGSVLCCFEQPVRAATPGQALVLYEGEHVFGGGTIISSYA